MSELEQLSRRDLERLSAYLDGALSAREKARLEARLRLEPGLRRSLRELQSTVELVRSLPEVRPPRSFALTPDVVAARARPRTYPYLQLGTALATLAFIFAVGVDVLGNVFFSPYSQAEMPREEVGEPAMLALDTRSPELLTEVAGEMGFREALSADKVNEGVAGDESIGEGAAAEVTELPMEEATPEPPEQPPGETSGPAPETPPVEPEAVEASEEEEVPAVAATSAVATEAALGEVAPNVAPMLGTPSPLPSEAREGGYPYEYAFAPPDGRALRFRSTLERLPWLRLAEVGFGALAVTLAALTLRARRRS